MSSTYSLNDPALNWVGYGQLPAGWSYDSSQGMYMDPMGLYKENYDSPFGSASEGEFLQTLGLGQYVNQHQTPDGTQWDVLSGAPTPYMGYDPKTGQIVVDAFNQQGQQVGNPYSYRDDKGGWLGPAIEIGALALTGYGLGAYAAGAGGADAGGAGAGAGSGAGAGAGAGSGAGSYGVGTVGASDIAPVGGAGVDAGTIGGAGSVTTAGEGASGAAGAGAGAGEGAAAGGYTTAAADSQAANAELGLGANTGSVPASVDLGSAGGVTSTGGSGFSNGLSNWWNKASHGDVNAIRAGLQGVGLLSSLFGGHGNNNMTAGQMRNALLGPYNSFNPTQQAAVQQFFNSPIRGPYVPPNVNGVVALQPQTGLAPAGALTAYQNGRATIQPISNPVAGYASGGRVCGALSSYGHGGFVQGASPGQADDVNAALSPGEYVMDADTVSALGDGNNEAGAAALDQMRQSIRAHKRSASPDKIPPKAKAPEQYLKGRK